MFGFVSSEIPLVYNEIFGAAPFDRIFQFLLITVRVTLEYQLCILNVSLPY